MQPSSLVEATYWGGWLCAVLALVYKALIAFQIIQVFMPQFLPRHLWQLSFLLFLACVAGYAASRAKST
ncbi:MAG: hypothetical protein HYY26_05445 [Acidobacteria bacterium]|nr:hypothetical protein [Acidobacteriota bacterium]